MAGREPNKIKVIGNKNHCKKIVDFLYNFKYSFIFLGTGGRSAVLKIAEIIIPAIEIVIIFEVKIGKLNDKIEKLNFDPPKIIGSQPSKNSKREAVAHDQKPSKIV